ncbi:CopG family transcriptional regulator [Halobellus captivus]|uniref:CopG family transcriptional regulator n=1 Tax=Halobellus captivus TaxID=2592614 RepID=UPI0011A763FE|nr:CopG family transcriptional regulator [Halobellus captivus]
MGTERVDGLPDELESWVADRAAAEGLTREEFLRRLVDAHRTSESEDGSIDIAPLRGIDGASSASESAVEELEELEEQVRDVTTRVAAVEENLDEKVADIRQRVIQVKRETDVKAPREHGHPDIERRMEAGFENYESILEYLAETTDEHDSKLDRVGEATVDLRRRVGALERVIDERTAAAEIRSEANRHGVVEAVCGACEESVHLGLLDSPRCPHCDAPIDGVEPKRGFFGSHRLLIGDRPALEASDETASTEMPTQGVESKPDDGTGDSAEDGGFRFGNGADSK